MSDLTHQISAVQRAIGRRTVATGEAYVSTISQTYATDIEDLWDACTNSERLPRWFLPVSGELKVGGHYQLEGNAGGTIEHCEKPHSFRATWEYDDDVSWIQVRLTPDGAGHTRLELEHVAHVTDERWAQFGPGATGVGWDLSFNALALHVASAGSPVDPAAAAAWMATPEGVEFMTLSSDAWHRAALAAGTPADEAAAAAAGTLAAYTAGPEAPESP